MGALLHIQASPRGDRSASTRVARAFLARYGQAHPDDMIETLDLFSGEIPEFEAPEAAAKYGVMAGQEPRDEAARAWKRVVRVIDHFKAADKIVIAAPMWNFSIPYQLKRYIDVIVQPGLTFTYSPAEGYRGLVTGRPAMLILARGGEYPAGSETAAYDMQRPYLELILRFIGFERINTILVEPTLMQGPEVAERKVEEAIARAEAAAEAF